MPRPVRPPTRRWLLHTVISGTTAEITPNQMKLLQGCLPDLTNTKLLLFCGDFLINLGNGAKVLSMYVKTDCCISIIFAQDNLLQRTDLFTETSGFCWFFCVGHKLPIRSHKVLSLHYVFSLSR